MGAWGSGPFDNDDACDWVYTLEESSDDSAIREALETVMQEEEYLDSSDCSPAIAAAEIVAALRGEPHPSLPDTAQQWVEENSHVEAAALVPLALSALERICVDSELRELWEEVDSLDEWLGTIDDLTTRLGGSLAEEHTAS